VVPSSLGGVPVLSLSIGNYILLKLKARLFDAGSEPSSFLKNLPASI
jgi:hypothetical protein